MEVYRESVRKWLLARPGGYQNEDEAFLAIRQAASIVDKLTDSELASFYLAIVANQSKFDRGEK